MAVIKSNEFGVRYALALTDDIPDDVPVWNPTGLHHRYGLDEIYTGKANIGQGNKGRYVPNVGDEAYSWDKGEFYVSAVNPTTLIATLLPQVQKQQQGANEVDFLLGVGSRYPQPGFFLYVDNEQSPPRASVDAQAIFRHPEVNYFVLYGGFSTAGVVEILSARFNSNNEYIDERIPRVTVPSEHSPDGVQYYTLESFPVTRQLNPGEPVKIVGYTASNVQITESGFVVRDGNYVRRQSSPVRQIVSAKLVSPYMSANPEEKIIRIPTGTLIESIPLSCELLLSGGKKLTLPIDGVKVRVQGLDEVVSSTPGYLPDVVLFYKLGEGEMYVGSQDNDGSALTERYKVQIDPTMETYGFKLFVYPTWRNGNEGYPLVAYLSDFDHSNIYDVTSLLEITANSREWDPLLYGTKQHLRLAVEVSKVDPRFTNYRHIQTVQITLIEQGTASSDELWRIYFEEGQNPPYGNGCRADLTYVSSQVWTANLKAGALTIDEWLDKLYYRTKPLFDPEIQTAPDVPSHFIYVISGQRYRRPISDWDKVFTVVTGGDDGQITLIHFVNSVNGVDLYLATAGLAIRQHL